MTTTMTATGASTHQSLAVGGKGLGMDNSLVEDDSNSVGCCPIFYFGAVWNLIPREIQTNSAQNNLLKLWVFVYGPDVEEHPGGKLPHYVTMWLKNH